MEWDIDCNVKGYQTDLKTGLLIPNTYFIDSNTLQSDLKAYMAYKIGTQGTDQAMNNLFATDGGITGGDVGYDGIAHGPDAVTLQYRFATSLNAGGNNSLAYIEYYGYIDGSVSLTGNLYLGFNLVYPTGYFTKTYSVYDINTSVAAGRRFHFYWKITVS